MKKVAIVGGGPSGLMSAFILSSHNIPCVIFESDNSLGKRLKISGNGRCNLFHHPIVYQNYSNPTLAKKYMSDFISKEKEVFSSLGLLSFDDEEGRTYPLSEQGKQIVSLFKNALDKNKAEIKLSSKVINIKKDKDKLNIILENEIIPFDYVILAIGGFSYRYNIKEKKDFYNRLNIALTKCNPSLTPIKTSLYLNRKLEGRRYDVNLSLFYKGKIIFKERGELLFKKDGISGIVSLNASSYIARFYDNNEDDFKINIDFLPDYDFEEIKKILYDKNFSLSENLERMFGEELKDELMLIYKKDKDLVSYIKAYPLSLKGLYPFEYSQVTSGGINPLLINEDGSLKNNELIYPCGEMLDVDGVSGGYNIAFAFASSYYVAMNIIKKIMPKKS